MDSLPLNPGDIAVIVILLVSAIFAFVRGFVREILSIGAWIGAAIATYYLYHFVRPYAGDLAGEGLIADVATGAGLFIVSAILLSLVAGLINRWMKESRLNTIDRSLGFMFGLLRGAVLVCLAYLLIVWMLPGDAPEPSWITQAKTRPLVHQGAELLRGLVPGSAMAIGEEALSGLTGSEGDPAAAAGPEADLPTESGGARIIEPLVQPQPPQPAEGESGYEPQDREDLTDLNESVKPGGGN